MNIPFFSAGFISIDQISGVITFDAEGDTMATSADLSVTVNGGTGFQISIADLSGLSPFDNEFGNWVNGVPTTWTLNVMENVTGLPEPESFFLSSNPFFGDLALRDEGSPTAIAGSFTSGSFTHIATNTSPPTPSANIVPEPKSLTVMLSFLALWLFFRGIGFCRSIWGTSRSPSASKDATDIVEITPV